MKQREAKSKINTAVQFLSNAAPMPFMYQVPQYQAPAQAAKNAHPDCQGYQHPAYQMPHQQVPQQQQPPQNWSHVTAGPHPGQNFDGNPNITYQNIYSEQMVYADNSVSQRPPVVSSNGFDIYQPPHHAAWCPPSYGQYPPYPPNTQDRLDHGQG
jgi:hypothetical protein